jgi:PAS domain S-box-containing protein
LAEEVDQVLLSSLIDIEELYEYAPCGYFSFLPDGTIIKINNTLLGWLGYHRNGVVNRKKITNLISKGNNIHYEMFFRPMINMSGTVKELNYDLIKSNNEILPALINATAVKDENNNLLAINVSVYDITDRKKYEQELLFAKKYADSEKKRFEILTHLIPEIVFTTDSTGNIDYVNKRFFEYFKLPSEKFDAKLIISKINPPDKIRTVKTWVESIASGENIELELCLCPEINKCEWHMIRAIPYKNTDGIITKWFGTCSNIDSHVQALQRKDEFINIASHELKTPITSMKAYLQLLEMSDLPPKYKSLVEKASSNVKNLQFLISNLLDVTIINSGQLQLNLSDFSLTKLAQECMEQINVSVQTHTIRLDNPDNDQFNIAGDRDRIREVILNLLNNAIKYSHEADSVILRLYKTNDAKKVTLEVQDFGLGIAEHQLNLIFEKYYRINDELSNKVSGFGLGLYIIQTIMMKHESRIHVKSKLHEGSTFYFSLPLHK